MEEISKLRLLSESVLKRELWEKFDETVKLLALDLGEKFLDGRVFDWCFRL